MNCIIFLVLIEAFQNMGVISDGWNIAKWFIFAAYAILYSIGIIARVIEAWNKQ